MFVRDSTEPSELTDRKGITVTLDPELDSMGFHRATVTGPTAEAVISYVRNQWGDDDPEWFRDHVVDRVEATAR